MKKLPTLSQIDENIVNCPTLSVRFQAGHVSRSAMKKLPKLSQIDDNIVKSPISSEQAAQTLSDRRQHSELSHLKRSFSSRTCIPIRHKEQALTPVLLIEESLDVVWRFIYVLVTCDCACAELCSDNCFDMYWVFSWCVWRKFLLICIALYERFVLHGSLVCFL